MKSSFVVVGLLLITLSAMAQDQNCSEQSLKGSYGFISSIRIVPPANSPVKQTARARFIGLITYDGAGKAEAGGIVVGPNGKPSPYTGSGTYKINAERCTGSVEFENKQNHIDRPSASAVMENAHQSLS